MSKGNTFENDMLKLIFNATTIANIANDAASSPLTSFRLSLHTADPGEAGDQTTNEVSYAAYSRFNLSRTTGVWTVTGNVVSPVGTYTFGVVTGGASGTITHVGIGTASSGAGKLLYSGALSPTIPFADGVAPSISANSTITED